MYQDQPGLRVAGHRDFFGESTDVSSSVFSGHAHVRVWTTIRDRGIDQNATAWTKWVSNCTA